MAKLINNISPLNEANLNGGYYIAFVSNNELVDGFTAKWGETLTITNYIPQKAGCIFTGWKCAKDPSGNAVKIYEDRVYEAQFSASTSYTFSYNLSNAIISPYYQTAVAGETISFTLAPDNDYIVTVVMNTTGGSFNLTRINNGYTFIMPSENITITAIVNLPPDPPHVHSYDFAYTYDDSIDNKNHRAYCSCGESITESHFFDHSYAPLDVVLHRAYCKCEKSKLEGHDFYMGSCRKCGFVSTLDDGPV